MDRKEEFYIMNVYDSMDKGYNSISGGSKTSRLSQEVKEKMSLSKKEYFKSHYNNRKGQKHSEESKKKISITKKYNFANGIIKHNWIGKKCSSETIIKRLATRAKNGNCNFYKIKKPDNTILVIRSLRKFCKDNNLVYGTVIVYVSKQKIYQGYDIKKITLEEKEYLKDFFCKEYM